VKKTCTINGFNFLRKSNVRRVYPFDDKRYLAIVSMFIGVRKRIRRRKFIVLFTRISGYVCRRISRMRELRCKGRSSPDIWMSRSNRMAHIYVRCIPRFFAGSEFLLMVARRDRRVKNASYFARLYLCLPYISWTLNLSPAFVLRGIPICMSRH